MIYLDLLWTFLKIGALTFGGGYAMIPLIQDAVPSHQWMSMQTLVDFIAVSESTPGPLAVNMATYVGAEVAGLRGSLCATLGVVLPSFVVILLVARCFERFQQSPFIKGCMVGLKPAVVGLIASAAVSIGSAVFAPNGWAMSLLAQPETYISLGIFLLALGLSFKKLHPITIICLSALLGLLSSFFI